MESKKKKILIASVAGLLTAVSIAASSNVLYAMGKKPEKAAENSCGGKNGCSGKNGCGGSNGCGSKSES